MKQLRPLSPEQSRVWTLLHNPRTTEIFFGGGAGPGKSFLGCLFEITDSLARPGSRGLIARERYEDLRKTTMLTFFEVLGMLGYTDGEHYRYNAQEHTVYWTNGSATFFDHLQYRPGDPEFNRLGSREYTRVFVDEAPDCDPKAIEVLGTRIRYRLSEHGTPGKLLLTGNAGDHWLKWQFVMDKENAPIDLPPHRACILTTYLSNPDEGFRTSYGARLERITDPYTKARLKYGDWMAAPKTGMEFLPSFDTSKHVQARFPFDADLPLHITLDFNAAPYMTLLVAQIRPLLLGKWHVQYLREYCLEHPLSTTKHVCEALKHEILQGAFQGLNAGLFYYGDASGKNRNTMASEEVRHNYDIVEGVLRRWMNAASDRVLRRNPPHTKARDFADGIMAGRLPVEVAFDPSMTTTIRDLQNTKTGPDGAILKVYAKDRATGVRYEQWGHCTQAVYYELIGAFPDLYADHANAVL